MKKQIDTQELLLHIAKQYIEPHLRYTLFDCSDSMHESENDESAFNTVCAFAGVKTDINKFIKKYLKDEYIKSTAEVVEESGYSEEDMGDYKKQLIVY